MICDDKKIHVAGKKCNFSFQNTFCRYIIVIYFIEVISRSLETCNRYMTTDDVVKRYYKFCTIQIVNIFLIVQPV